MVGLYPITPLQEAGILIEPPVSVPNDIGSVPVPTLPALPPLDPPAVLSLSKALLAEP
jgi:hypothetical protein